MLKKNFINKSNVNYQRLFNNLYYVEIDSKNEVISSLVFSESFNHNWKYLKLKKIFSKMNIFIIYLLI